MKIRLSLFLILFLCICQTAILAQSDYGALKVFTEVRYSQIYIDSKWAGEDSVFIEMIEPGTHYVRVESDGRPYFSKLVEIRSGEVTTVLAQAAEEMPKKEEKKVAAAKPSAGTAPRYSLYLCATNSNYKPSALGYSEVLDIGTRMGVGGSVRMAVAENIYFDGGFKYYLTEGSFDNSAGGTTKVAVNPLYGNMIFMPSPGFFFGAGVNYSFWSLHGTDSGGGTMSATPSSGLGVQVLSGFEYGILLFELGYVVMSATYTESGITMDMQSSGFYLNGGLKI